MLKVYRVTNYVLVNGNECYKVGRCHDTMLDNLKITTTTIDNGSFDEWCEFLQEQELDGIYYTTTFLRKKPCIVTHNWGYDDYKKYTHFDTLSYKSVYREMPDVSLNYIMRNFPADKCIQYLKERGITTCPMNL